MTDHLRSALANEALTAIDCHFGTFIAERTADSSCVPLLAAKVSQDYQDGHTCFDLRHVAEFDGYGYGLRETTSSARNALLASGVCGPPGWEGPLVLDQDRVYLGRAFRDETDLALALRTRAADSKPLEANELAKVLDRVFPRQDGVDLQRTAAMVALAKKLAVIVGGPGTGKSSTVVRIVAAVLSTRSGSERPRIGIAAPTGKAAARLTAAIREGIDLLDCSDDLKRAIPTEVVTLHRLLGYNPRRMTLRYDRTNRLPLEWLIVDEFSMVDLALAANLVRALPPSSPLILAGDHSQLVSVKAGSVLADICTGLARYDASKQLRREAQRAGAEIPGAKGKPSHPLRDCLVQLDRNYRFGENPGLNRFAEAVLKRDARFVTSGEAGDAVHIRPLDVGGLVAELAAGYAPYLALLSTEGAAEPDLLAAFARYRVLAALRQGELGASRLAIELERWYREHHRSRGTGAWYHGRPIMVTTNDHTLGLYNGDVGVTVVDAAGSVRIVFPQDGGDVKAVSPGRLPAHEVCWAMTVHKAQGSEFERVAVVLPDLNQLGRPGLVSRQLLYTAVTRARRQVTIHCLPQQLPGVLDRDEARASGLAERLYGLTGEQQELF